MKLSYSSKCCVVARRVDRRIAHRAVEAARRNLREAGVARVGGDAQQADLAGERIAVVEADLPAVTFIQPTRISFSFELPKTRVWLATAFRVCVVSVRPNPGTSDSCSALVPNGWRSSASNVLKRAKSWSELLEAVIDARAELVQVARRLLGRREVLEVPAGIRQRHVAEKRRRDRVDAVRGNLVVRERLCTRRWSGSSAGRRWWRARRSFRRARPPSAPRRPTSATGAASCPRSCRRRTSGSGRGVRRSTPPNWFWRSGGSGWSAGWKKLRESNASLRWNSKTLPRNALVPAFVTDVDEGRRLAAELRRIHRLLDLELLDRIDRRVEHEVVEQLVGHLRAVHQVDVVARALAADVRELAGLAERAAARAARRNHDAHR